MKNKYKDVALGTIEAVFNKLGGMAGIDQFLCGNTEIKVIKHIIDLGKRPEPPRDDLFVHKHKGKGLVEIELRSDDNLYIDDKKVELFLSKKQKGSKWIVGDILYQELKDRKQVLLNGNVLDYIHDHPELFPEHWKKDENGNTRHIYFWGSVFVSNPVLGFKHVRYLYWDDHGHLYYGSQCFNDDNEGWSYQSPAASLASN